MTLVEKIKKLTQRTETEKDLASAEFWFNENRRGIYLIILI